MPTNLQDLLTLTSTRFLQKLFLRFIEYWYFQIYIQQILIALQPKKNLEISMKKFIITLTLFLLLCNISFAKPTLTKSKYLIACLANGTTGTVSPGSTEYPLVFYPDRDSETANDSDYWVVKDLGSGQYAFQNTANLKYIKYNSASANRTALVLVDALQTDGSTSWTLELRQTNNLSYYVIRSVDSTAMVWNKRATSYGGLYPVGVYTASNTNLEDFLFYDMDGNPVIDDGSMMVTMPTVKPTLGAFAGMLDSLKIGGKVPVVDTAKKGFYLTLPESQMTGGDVTMKVFYVARNSAHKLAISGIQLNSGSNFTFSRMSGTTGYLIEIKNGTTVIASGMIYFSSLPLVQLYSDATLTATYTLGRIVVTEPDTVRPAEYLLSNLKTRGAYAASLVKKAYSIKLKDVDGMTSLERSFFGLRSDNNWILDAMGIDLSRMRNRVSTDLWNDFSVKPYYAKQEPNMVNGTRGNYVEVFLNDSYNGLYCMTEKIDRKQLNLKKFKAATSTTAAIQRGALFKADDWSFASVMGNPLYSNNGTLPSYNNTLETWCYYAVKYPDLGDGELIEWKALWNAVYLTSYLTPEATFHANAETYFDLPVVRDYYLFIELLLAADNQGKNLYFSIYDQTVSPMISMTPWDLDATWGRRWDGSSSVTGPNQSFDTFVANYEHGQSNLFLRLKKLNTKGFNDQLKIRYRELRGSYFDYSQLMARFQNNLNKLKTSGAFNREITRWTGTRVAADTNFDLSFLSTWITARLSYLDKQYLGGPFTDNTDVTIRRIEVAPNPVRDLLTVYNVKFGDLVQIISLQGSVMAQVQSDGNNVVVDMSQFAQGVYIVKAGGAIAKVIKN